MDKTFILIVIFFFLFAANMNPQKNEEGKANVEELPLDKIMDIGMAVSPSDAKSIFTTASTVTVIDRDMIESYNFLTISEALRIVAGFTVLPTYHKRDLPTSRGVLQNQYSNRILFLIDGIPSWHSITGEANIERININAVERIEVLKGPASVLYGSNAYSGAVNVVLKSCEKESSQVHMGIGDHYSIISGGNYGFKKKHFQFFAAGGIYDEKGIHYPWTDQAGVSGYFYPYFKSRDIIFSLKYKSHTLLFNGASSSQAFFGPDPKFSEGAGNSHDTDGYLFNYTFATPRGKPMDLRAGIIYDWNQVNFSLSADDNLRINWAGSRLCAFLKSTFNIADKFRIEIGADYDYRKCENSKVYMVQQDQTLTDNGISDKTVYEYSILGQVGYQSRSFNLLIGSRLTKNEFFGTNFSTRGTLVCTITPRNSLKFIFGQSYRSPSILEVHLRTHDDSRFGNLDLRPETSDSFEMVYLTSFKNIFIQVLGYYANYHDKIIRVPFGDNAITFANTNSFSAKGVEFEIKYKNPKLLNFFCSYNFIDGDDGDIDKNGHYNFKYIPKHSLAFGINKNIKRFLISALIDYWTETEGPVGKVDPQYIINVNLGYTHILGSIRLRHALSLKNATNRDVLFPEYADRKGGLGNLNTIPIEFGYGRKIMYSFTASF